MMSIWTVLTALPSLVEEGPAPEDVKAGWLGFSVWIALVVAVVILGLSLRKQLKRVNFEEKDPEGGENGKSERGSMGIPEGPRS